MLTIFGPGGDVLLVTRDVISGRNQAEKSFKRGVMAFERSLQFCGRDHFVSTAELGRGRWLSAV